MRGQQRNGRPDDAEANRDQEAGGCDDQYVRRDAALAARAQPAEDATINDGSVTPARTAAASTFASAPSMIKPEPTLTGKSVLTCRDGSRHVWGGDGASRTITWVGIQFDSWWGLWHNRW
jgi:hypothetical protein